MTVSITGVKNNSFQVTHEEMLLPVCLQDTWRTGNFHKVMNEKEVEC